MDDHDMVFEEDDVVRKDDIFYSPCAFNPEGVSEAVCRSTSAVAVRNRRCCAVQCGSAARACRACVLQPGTPADARNRVSGLCEFHELHGESAVRPAPAAPTPFGAKIRRPAQAGQAPMARSSSGVDILARIRRAMSESVLVTLDARRVRPMPDQPRKHFDPTRLASLAESLRAYGQIMPGIVRAIEPDAEGHTHEVLDGERRWRGCIIGGLKYRALLVDIDDEAAPYVVSVIANFNRDGHTLLEIADAVRVMTEGLRMSQAQIGEAMGMHPVIVSRYYGLRRLEPEVRDMFDPNLLGKDKLLPKTAAFKLSQYTPAEQIAKAKALKAGTLTLAELIHGYSTAPGSTGRKQKFRELESKELWRSLSRRGESIEGKLGNLISLMRKAPIPENPISSSSVVLAKRTLLRVERQIQEALQLVGQVRVPE